MNKLVVIFIAAFLLRLINVNQSLWLDEAVTAKVVTQFNFSQILSTFSPTDFHPPLYYFFMKVWTGLVGYSEIALRMPSVLFSLITGWYVCKIGVALKKEEVGFWATVFFLFNPLIVYYSQEARMYMMATMFITAALYYYILLQHEKKNFTFNLIAINILLFLSFSTFYGTIFFISGLFIWLLLQKQYKLFFLIHPGFHLSLLTHAPLLYSQFLNAKRSLVLVPHWSSVLGTVNLKNILLFPLKFFGGRISFEPKLLYYLISGVWSFVNIYFVAKGSLHNKMLHFLIVYPLFTALIFSVFTPLLQYFRFLFLLPLICLLIAYAIKNTRIATIVAGIFLLFSLAYLLVPQFHREDWKGLAEKVSDEREVYMAFTFTDPFAYYIPQVKANNLLGITTTPPTARKVTVIPYAIEIFGFDYKTTLRNSGYTLRKTENVRGLHAEEWVR